MTITDQSKLLIEGIDCSSGSFAVYYFNIITKQFDKVSDTPTILNHNTSKTDGHHIISLKSLISKKGY
jgi:hypothetical protein